MSHKGTIEIEVKVSREGYSHLSPGCERIKLTGDLYTIQNTLKTTSILLMAQQATRDLNDRIEPLRVRGVNDADS